MSSDSFPVLVLATANKVVKLSSNGPIVQGGTITFEAIALNNDVPATGKFEFLWKDNAIPSHEKKVSKSTWSLNLCVNFNCFITR